MSDAALFQPTIPAVIPAPPSTARPLSRRARARIGSIERRLDRRYQIEAELEYRVIVEEKIAETGNGRTVNFSSRGILFESDCALAVGSDMELSVAWPVMLNNEVALKLCVSGAVARSEGNRHAIRILRYEFRLRGRNGLSGRRLPENPVPQPEQFSQK